MRRRIRFAMVIGILALGLPGTLCAQGLGNMAMPTNMGPIMGSTSSAPRDTDPALSINDTFVSFIDSAVPRTVIGLRFDATYNNRQPSRATYVYPKGGLPGGIGFPLPETRVDAQDLTTIAEYSLTPWLSFFMEGTYRWINPEVNSNTSGASDMKYGMKLCTWSDENVIATVLLRIYQPTAKYETLGTGHWSIEPGLLAAYRISPMLHLEGEVRYWIPLGGGDFAGDILRYGVGLSYGQRNANGVWYMPVAEAIGWTVLGGKTMLASSPDNFVVQEARNQTIANAYLGMRIGYAQNVDLYLGYGRSFTGQFWSRETYRVEFRLSY